MVLNPDMVHPATCPIRFLSSTIKAIKSKHDLPCSSGTNYYFKTDKLLKLQDHYKFNLCSQLFHYLICNVNFTVASRFQLHSYIDNHNARHRSNLVLPHFHRSKLQLLFIFQSIKEWNNKPKKNVSNEKLVAPSSLN